MMGVSPTVCQGMNVKLCTGKGFIIFNNHIQRGKRELFEKEKCLPQATSAFGFC